MAEWKKVIVSGSSANLASLQVDNLITGVVTGSSDGTLGIQSINGTGSILATTGATGVEISGSFSGSFFGDGGGLTNISASSIVGLNMSMIATGSVTASVNVLDNAFTVASESIQLFNVRANGGVEHGNAVTASGAWSHAQGGSGGPYATLQAIGDYSHAEGYDTIAYGYASHAEGELTLAYGQYSHAEGYYTTASGDFSHAEGESTVAYGYAAHAEGYNTISSGSYSHAEGSSTTASGDSAHAEGLSTIASGDFSHAEGSYTKTGGDNGYLAISVSAGLVTLSGSYGDVSADYPTGNYLYFNDYAYDNSYSTGALIIDSTSFNGTETEILLVDTGINTTTAVVGNINLNPANWTGDQVYGAPYSHTEGEDTLAIGYAAHAEGANTQAIGQLSHAEGSTTRASGQASHAEGNTTTASGDYSHAEGEGTIASGLVSHAEGASTTASGDSAHAEGYGTTASGDYSHAEGDNSLAFGDYSHAEGESTTAFGHYSHAEGSSTIASGSHSHAEGANTTASGLGAHAEGNNSLAFGDYSHAEGNSTIASGSYSHAEGDGATASGDYSHAEGATTTAIGDFSHAEGEGTITSGSYSHAEGRNTVTSGDYSHAEGEDTIAYGLASHAEGNVTIAYGYASHAEGDNTIASGSNSHAEGSYTVASGSYSHAEGDITEASGYAAHAEGSGTIASGGASHTEGKSTLASGLYSHAEGEETVAYGQSSHAEGIGTIASGSGQLAAGRYNTQGNTDSLVVIGNGVDDANRSDLALFNSQSITFNQPVTGSIFSGSFIGSFSGTTDLPDLTEGTGIVPFIYDGGSTATVAISGAAALSDNTVVKWDTGDGKFLDTTITDDGTLVTFSGDALFQGDITVQGTASFQNTENLLVADRFVLFGSGSNAAGDGGIVVQQGVQNVGELFGYENSADRWGFTSSFDASSTSYTPAAFVAAVIDMGAGQSDIAQYQKNGNIKIDTGDIWIYA
jgi:hypothetical protein